MHQQPLDFIARVRAARPLAAFTGDVIEAGSLNMNGSTRDTVLADHTSWLGVDWRAGDGVDLVGVFHEMVSLQQYDTVVTTEMAEHDPHWRKSLAKMVALLKDGGNLWFTCAARARPVHEKHVGIDAHYEGLDLVDVLAELRRLADFDEIICAQNVAPADTYIAALGKRPNSGGYIGQRVQLSAVIPTCQAGYVRRCLKTHAELSAGVSEFVVVVNGASPEDEDALLRAGGPAVLAFYDVNLGFPEACNVGLALRHKDAVAVALINDDTEALVYEWDERVLTILTEEEGIGALSPVTNFIANKYQMHGVVPTPELYEVPVLYFTWVAMLVTTVDQIGPLDRRFGLGNYEDADYSLRMLDAGLRLVVDPVHVVYHRGHGTFGLLPPGQFAAVMKASEAVLRTKYGARLQMATK